MKRGKFYFRLRRAAAAVMIFFLAAGNSGLIQVNAETSGSTAGTLIVCAGGEAGAADAISGTAGTFESENYTNLFDEDTTTKWCIQNFRSACVIWEMSEAVSVTGYTVVSGNDCKTYTGRNPKSWQLYACNAESDPDEDYEGWVLIDSVSDSQMEDKNFEEYYFEIPQSLPEYKYYKLVIDETQGATTMQIAEFSLDYDGAADYVCLISDEDGLLSDEMKETLSELFVTVYPQMAAGYNENAPKFVKIYISSGDSIYTLNSRIYLSASYLTENPRDYDCLTHELMHVVQHYPVSDPSWLIEGIADYARYVYGLNNEAAGWSLKTPTAQSSYTDSYRTAAAFLNWLETESGAGSGIVKELDARLRNGTYDTEGHSDWEEITGKSLDDLWSDYLKACGVITQEDETGTEDEEYSDEEENSDEENTSGASYLAYSSQDGVWYYYTDGEVNTSYTGLASNSAGTWYVEDGVVDFGYTGLAAVDGVLYYISYSKVSTNTGLYKFNGIWYYFVEGAVDYTYTGLVKNSAGWWYVEDSIVDFDYTGLVEYNGSYWYVYNSNVKFVTGLYKIDGTWYYISNGAAAFSFSGIVSNSAGSWYVEDGIVDFGYTGLIEYDGILYYVSYSKVSTNTGLYKFNGTWYYFVEGAVDYTYTGLVKNSAGWWYVEDSIVDFDYTGLAEYNGSYWYVYDSNVKFVTGLYYINGTWYYIKNGAWASSYTGLASNSAGTWYVQNGVVSLSYNGTVTISGTKYTIKNSLVVS